MATWKMIFEMRVNRERIDSDSEMTWTRVLVDNAIGDGQVLLVQTNS
jgi:hypothetical protein